MSEQFKKNDYVFIPLTGCVGIVEMVDENNISRILVLDNECIKTWYPANRLRLLHSPTLPLSGSCLAIDCDSMCAVKDACPTEIISRIQRDK